MTGAELVILSLLAEQARHGYELEQVIEERGMRDWTEIGFSSIYYVLKKLEGQGLIERRSESAESRGPARAVYHMTQAGLVAWHAAAYEALSEPHPAHSPFLLGLANLPGLSPAEVEQAVNEYRARLTERRDQLRSRWKQEERGAPYFVHAMFDYSVTLIEAELAWTQQFLSKYFSMGESSVPAPAEKRLYTARREPEIIEVPHARFLTFSGQGAPESEAFHQAVGALFAVAYGVRFRLKAGGIDAKVSPLEGLWWGENQRETPRSEWHWKLLIRLPDDADDHLVELVRHEVMAKKRLPGLDQVHVERITEGPAAQVLHVGPFSAEPETIARLHEYIHAQGFELHGLHHEIYLSDFRRTAPEKLRTILRQPVRKA